MTDHRVPLADGRTMTVDLQLPDGPAPMGGWPGVVVLHEVFGLTSEIRDVGARFAAAGWAVAVPDFFSAGTTLGCLVKAAREINGHKPGPVTEDLAEVARWLGSRPEADGDRLGVIGFCLGGGFALLLGAVDGTGIRAVSANYGEVPDEATVAKLPPVVGSYGGRDRLYGPKAAKLRDRLDACGITNEISLYDDAGHSFLTPAEHKIASVLMGPVLRPGYVQSAADQAWPRIFAFLDEHVRGQLRSGRRPPGGVRD